MELQLDTSKKYAVALEGGGAKGAYEVGVWQALHEAGVKISAVSGASVGALNGAMMVMGDLEKAISLWEHIRFSQVVDVDDETVKGYYDKRLSRGELIQFFKDMADVVKKGGFDSEPLRRLLEEVVDEEQVRQSETAFYFVTYSLSDRKELDLDVKELPKGSLIDMLLASAYFPAFKQEPLGGKWYTDGGIQNVIPIDCLLKRGYRDIIAIRIFGVGMEKKIEIPEDAEIIQIAPREKLGGVLQFDGEQAKQDIQLGYYDGLRMLYDLVGENYYIDRKWTEEKAYEVLKNLLLHESEKNGEMISLRELNEERIPRLAKKMKEKGDYYTILLRILEKRAEDLGISPFQVLTEEELYGQIVDKQ